MTEPLVQTSIILQQGRIYNIDPRIVFYHINVFVLNLHKKVYQLCEERITVKNLNFPGIKFSPWQP